MDLQVHRWINSTTKHTYVFGKDKMIDICIFKDDTIIKALNKIVVGIHSIDSSISLNTIPFIWWRSKSIRFDVDTSIKNPFTDTYKNSTHANISYKNDDLFNLEEVNIVFLDDIKHGGVNTNTIHILFPDKKNTWNPDTYKIIKDESERLYKIWISGYNTSIEKYSIQRVNLIAKVTLRKSIVDIFTSTKCDSKTQFMQLIEDSSHILYKLHKTHTIPVSKLTEWTSYNNIPKIQVGVSILNVMFHIKDTLFAHVMIDSNGQIYVRFKFDISNKYELIDIQKYCTSVIEKWLTNTLQVSITLHDDSYFLKTLIPISVHISSKDYGKILSKENLLFNLSSADKDILYIDYLRSKSHTKTEILDYIRGRAKLGISLQDIKQELLEKQLSDADISLWFEQYISELQALEQQIVNPEAPKPRKKKTISLGCTLKVQTKKYEIIVSLENASSIEEANTACTWIRGTVHTYLESLQKQKAVAEPKNAGPSQPEQPAKKPNKVLLESSSSSSSSSSASKNVNGRVPNDADDFDIDLGGGSRGGAGGKELHGFLLKALKKADPKVFDGPDRYSEQCQANNFRQPIVLTPEEKAHIDTLNYTSNADDYLLYGSHPENKNYYTCPRIWCPISKIPLTIQELEKLNNKCPGPHFEEPIHMYKDNYWRKSPDTKHHIGFLSKLNNDKLCMPCCGKTVLKPNKLQKCNLSTTDADSEKPQETKPASEREPEQNPEPEHDESNPENKPKRGRKKMKNSESKNTDDEKTYIIDKIGILDANRYGLIPQDLHTYLYPNTSYNDCSKSLSTTECVVRKGQGHVDDYFLESVAYASGFKDKLHFLKHIVKICDPLTFITLTNGYIFTAFMEDPIVFSQNNKNELYNEWISYLETHQNYVKTLQLNDILHTHGTKQTRMEIDLTNTIVLRELIIFKALKNFIKYLKSPSQKNPQHVFDLLHRMGILLAVWHRNSTSSASLVCPEYTNLNDLTYVAKHHEKVAMVLEDNTQYLYEPLEMKIRSKEGVSLFPVSGRIGSNIKDLLLQSCSVENAGKDTPKPLIQNIFVEMIRTLETWIDLQLAPRSSPFLLKTILLRADGKLYGFLTHNNLLLTCPNANLEVVPLLFKTCKNLKNISYIEDVSGSTLDITFMGRDDYIQFLEKIGAYGLGLFSGSISQEISTLHTSPIGLRGQITLPTVPYGLYIPLVPLTTSHTLLEKYKNANTKHNAKWYQLQNAVSSELLKYYESLVVPLLKETKKVRINTLLHIWKKLPEKDLDKVQVILETLPLDSKENLIYFIQTIGIENNARIYLSSRVYDTNKDWIFSQAAIEDGLPHTIYVSNKEFIPNDYTSVVTKHTYNMKNVQKDPTQIRPIPSIINISTGTLKSLPKKWTKGWMTFKILEQSQNIYTSQSLPQLFEWISYIINGTDEFYSWEKGVVPIRNSKLQKIFNTQHGAEEILEIDSSLFHTWNIYLHKKYKTPAEMLKTNYTTIKNEWNTVVQLHNDIIYPMDIDLNSCAQMLNITILVLFRTKYGTTKEVEEIYKRGDLEDLITSANLFSPTTANDMYLERPCIVLYREKEPKVPFIKYSVLLNTSEKVDKSAIYEKCFYTNINSMPEDIIALIKALRNV